MATLLNTDFSKIDSVTLPQELRKTPPKALEDYVQARLNQLVVCLCRELSQHEQPSVEVIQALSKQIIQTLPGVSAQPAPLAQRDLSLRFTHDCSALGCLDFSCHLCKDNPTRKCETNFSPKYCVRDNIKAACGSNIRIEVVDTVTGDVVTESIPNLKLEVIILDGVQYKSRFLENGDLVAGTESYNAELDKCALYFDNKSQPLLTAQSGNSSGANDQQGRLILSMQGGKAELVDVIIVRSSEAMLSGRRPPFRLCAKIRDGTELNIKPVVSEAFVVNTRRARNDGKATVPVMDDDVGKLDHMGRETVKKLQDLRAAAQVAGEKLDIPDIKVQTVSEFRQLALRADQDSTLKARLLHILKLSKDKWEEAKEHAMKAVAMDNSMRGWNTKNEHTSVKLLFKCRHGVPDLSMPAAYSEMGVMSYPGHWQDNIRDILRQLAVKARRDWHKPGHPNWEITNYDSDLFGNPDGTDTAKVLYNKSPSSTVQTVATPDISVIQVGPAVLPSPRPGTAGPQPGGRTMSGTSTLQAAPSETSNHMSGVDAGQGGHGPPGGMPRARRDSYSQSDAVSAGKRGRTSCDAVYNGSTSMATSEYQQNPTSPYEVSPASRYEEDTPFMAVRDKFHPGLRSSLPHSATLYQAGSGGTSNGNAPQPHLELHSPKQNTIMGAPAMAHARSPALARGNPQVMNRHQVLNNQQQQQQQQYDWDGNTSVTSNGLPPSSVAMAPMAHSPALSPQNEPLLQPLSSGNAGHLPRPQLAAASPGMNGNDNTPFQTRNGYITAAGQQDPLVGPHELYLNHGLLMSPHELMANGHQGNNKAWDTQQAPASSQPGGYTHVSGANSPAGLSRQPANYNHHENPNNPNHVSRQPGNYNHYENPNNPTHVSRQPAGSNNTAPDSQQPPGGFPFSVPEAWLYAQNGYRLPHNYQHHTTTQHPGSMPLNTSVHPVNFSSPIPLSQAMDALRGMPLPADFQTLPSLMVPSINLQVPSFELIDADPQPIDPSQLDPATMQQLLGAPLAIPSCEMGESLGLLHSLVLEDEVEDPGDQQQRQQQQ